MCTIKLEDLRDISTVAAKHQDLIGALAAFDADPAPGVLRLSTQRQKDMDTVKAEIDTLTAEEYRVVLQLRIDNSKKQLADAGITVIYPSSVGAGIPAPVFFKDGPTA